MLKPIRRLTIKSPQTAALSKLPEKVRLKVINKKKAMPDRSPRPARLDNIMRTDKHVGDLKITYGYESKYLKSSTRETLIQIKRNINTTLENIEKDIDTYSKWDLSRSEFIAFKFLKDNYQREKKIIEKKLAEIENLLASK